MKITAFVEYSPFAWWSNRLQVLYSGTIEPDGATNFAGAPDEIDEDFAIVDFYASLDVGPGDLQIGVSDLLDEDYFPVAAQAFGLPGALLPPYCVESISTASVRRQRSRPMLLAGHTPVQIAYFVPDIRTAAVRHARTFGSGPFYAVDHIEFAWCRYRGEPTDWDQGSSFGQWGEVMVEFMQQNRPGASVLHDIYPPDSGRYGAHHMAYLVEDTAAVATGFERAGHAIALHGALTNGIEVYMIDTVALYGHMIELYVPTAALREVYDFIRSAAVGYDGTDPVRDFSFD